MNINQTIKLGVTLLALIGTPLAHANAQAPLVNQPNNGLKDKHGTTVTMTLNKKQRSAAATVGSLNHTLQITGSNWSQLSAPPG